MTFAYVFYMIQPKFAGQFYEASPNKLQEQVKSCFTHDLGPGELPLKRGKVSIKGVIVPHAGYEFSGPCAAWAYKALAEAKAPSTFVILAPDHNGIHEQPTTTLEEMSTPLGAVMVNKSFVNALVAKCPFVKVDKISEHAIEVQLPFLQVTQADIPNLKIVPIVVPSIENYKELAAAISEIDEDAVVICSTDLTHFGPKFDYVPFKYKVEENLKQLDMGVIDALARRDSAGFVKYVKKTGATVCGANAILVALEVMKFMLAEKGELLNYYSSSRISGDWANSVSYCAMRFD